LLSQSPKTVTTQEVTNRESGVLRVERLYGVGSLSALFLLVGTITMSKAEEADELESRTRGRIQLPVIGLC
jgi:hypothetical protein